MIAPSDSDNRTTWPDVPSICDEVGGASVTAVDGLLEPAAVRADTLQLYDADEVRPETVSGLVAAVPTASTPPGDEHVASKAMIGAPPSGPASKLRTAVEATGRSPDRLVGASGGFAVARGSVGAESGLVPPMLVAVTTHR
jgi:hypothetical protein